MTQATNHPRVQAKQALGLRPMPLSFIEEAAETGPANVETPGMAFRLALKPPSVL